MLWDKAEDELNFNIFVGFDGFVDKILKPVRMKDKEGTEFFLTMKEFADYLIPESVKLVVL